MEIYVINYNCGMYDTYREWLSEKAYKTKQAAHNALKAGGYIWDGRFYSLETDDPYDWCEGLILAEIKTLILEE